MAIIRSIGFKGGFFENEVKLNLFGAKEKNTQGSLIFGRNGSGKSTITRLIRKFKEESLSTNEIVRFYDKQSMDITESIDKKSLFVFDEEFIYDNIRFKTDDGLETIIMIGDQVEVQEQIVRLSDENKYLEGELTTIDINSYNDPKNVLSPLYYDNKMLNILREDNGWARIDSYIKGHVNKSQVNSFVLNEILNYSNTKNVTELKKQFDIDYKYYDTIRNFTTILPEVKIKIELVTSEDKLIKKLSEELEKPIGDKWVDRLNVVSSNFGTNHALNIVTQFNKNKEYCPFCLRDMNEQDIENVINAVRVQQNIDVELFRLELDGYKNSLIESFNLSQYDVIPDNNSMEIDRLIKEYNKYVQTTNELINQRLNDIFKTVYLEKIKVDDVINELISEIETLNDKVKQFNSDVNNSNKIKEKLIILNKEIFFHSVKELAKQQKKQEKEKNTITQKYNMIENSIYEKKSEINRLTDKQKNIDIAVELLNRFLSLIFLSKDRLKINLESGQYKILSNNITVAKQNLSTGERNAIALCYFFSLMNASMSMSNLFTKESIVFIDDPVSSFDVENRIGIFSFIKTVLYSIVKCNSNSSVVIFSHKIDVFLDMLKVYDDISNDYDFNYEHYRLEAQKLYNMKSKNIYKILLKDIYKYTLEAVDNNESISIGNKMRRVLESFSFFNYNANFYQLTKDEVIMSKITDENLQKYFSNFMKRLLLNNESHFEESVYSIETQSFYQYIEFTEKLKTAKSTISLLYLFDKVHVMSHLYDEKDELQIFRNKEQIEANINLWISTLVNQ